MPRQCAILGVEFNANERATQLERHTAHGARSRERIENQIADLASGLHAWLDQRGRKRGEVCRAVRLRGDRPDGSDILGVSYR